MSQSYGNDGAAAAGARQGDLRLLAAQEEGVAAGDVSWVKWRPPVVFIMEDVTKILNIFPANPRVQTHTHTHTHTHTSFSAATHPLCSFGLPACHLPPSSVFPARGRHTEGVFNPCMLTPPRCAEAGHVPCATHTITVLKTHTRSKQFYQNNTHVHRHLYVCTIPPTHEIRNTCIHYNRPHLSALFTINTNTKTNAQCWI